MGQLKIKKLLCMFLALLGCCIYQKQRMFGESSSSSEGESDDDCKMCRKQQKGNYHKHKDDPCNGDDAPQGAEGGE